MQLLGGSSGLDVARYLHEVGEAKFVFITANPSMIDLRLFGGIGVLSKPFTNAKLVSTLRYLHQGVIAPPPSAVRPVGLILGPNYDAAWS